MDAIWDARRRKLEDALEMAALDLFEHSAANALKVPIHGTTPPIFIVIGDTNAIKSLVEDKA